MIACESTRLVRPSSCLHAVVRHQRRRHYSPAAAGQRAAELARQKQQVQNNKWPQTMETQLSHAGVVCDGNSRTNLALSPPIELATTYTRPQSGPYAEGDPIYSRADNPTRVLLENTIAQLELPDDNSNMTNSADNVTCAFASGMMAASSLILASTMPITVLLPRDLYHGVSTVIADVFVARFGVKVAQVDMSCLEAVEQALHTVLQSQKSGSILVWMETPSNPKCDILDIAGVSQLADRLRSTLKTIGITTVVDSTLAPPVMQKPLELGVDVVMHSGTKYLAGHSDALLGVVTCSPYTKQGRSLAELLRQTQVCVGGVASPMDAWLTLRGLRTLSCRVQRQCRTALALANHFVQHDSSLITAVHYPGLPSHPQHDLAKRQMKHGHYGGVLSVELSTESAAMAFAGALQVMFRATSLGGTETLIEHRASIEPANRVVSPPGLLRISVGLESSSDLARDIDQALVIAEQVVNEQSL